MRTARFEAKTSVEGPGLRSALWLQGCSIKCPDCCNPELQTPDSGCEVNVNELVKKILAANADGLTLLGGEPLDQAVEVLELLKALRQANYTGIIMFTGYEWAAIISAPAKKLAAELCDLVIAGPFVKNESPGKRRWIGSDNQTTHFVTPFYKDLQQNWPENIREIEIFIKDGVIMVNGTPLESDHELSRIFDR